MCTSESVERAKLLLEEGLRGTLPWGVASSSAIEALRQLPDGLRIVPLGLEIQRLYNAGSPATKLALLNQLKIVVAGLEDHLYGRTRKEQELPSRAHDSSA